MIYADILSVVATKLMHMMAEIENEEVEFLVYHLVAMGI